MNETRIYLDKELGENLVKHLDARKDSSFSENSCCLHDFKDLFQLMNCVAAENEWKGNFLAAICLFHINIVHILKINCKYVIIQYFLILVKQMRAWNFAITTFMGYFDRSFLWESSSL